MRHKVWPIVVLVALIALGCQMAPRIDNEAERAKLQAALDGINAAWESEDIEAFSRLVAHDEEMVNFGSDVSDRWVGWDQLEEGLRGQFEAFSDTVVTPRHVDIRISPAGDTAWLAQAMNIKTKMMGSPLEIEARITGVFAKRGTDWLMVQFHYSIPISESRRLTM
jgi:ketosteroid isomerase-like protein